MDLKMHHVIFLKQFFSGECWAPPVGGGGVGTTLLNRYTLMASADWLR
jgi:hypothetical protein